MIPKTFSIVNRKWLVKSVTDKQLQIHLNKYYPELEAETVKGLCDDKNNLIFINKDAHSSEADMTHTFWHELAHTLKFANGEYNHDEVEVDRLGGFLHQFDLTKK